ncbi:hypothetical protein TrCOL_g1177 [Triparma columacea]|nr:hypothetical protein TrCOL_g1177 [Triparma columacea]
MSPLVSSPSAPTSSSTSPTPHSSLKSLHPDQSLISTIPSFLCSNRVSILLIFAPCSIIPYYLLPLFLPPSDPTILTLEPYLFVFSLLALIPSAERLGYATEQISHHTSQTKAGLINATFGNLSELILSIIAMRDRLYRIVQLSLLGSILSNLLLVLGCSCYFGGLTRSIQPFTTVSGSVNPGLLWVATSGLALPAALKMSGQMNVKKDDVKHEVGEVEFSRGLAAVMLVMYGSYLWFSLRTNMFEFDQADGSGVGDMSVDNNLSEESVGLLTMEMCETGEGGVREEDVEGGAGPRVKHITKRRR